MIRQRLIHPSPHPVAAAAPGSVRGSSTRTQQCSRVSPRLAQIPVIQRSCRLRVIGSAAPRPDTRGRPTSSAALPQLPRPAELAEDRLTASLFSTDPVNPAICSGRLRSHCWMRSAALITWQAGADRRLLELVGRFRRSPSSAASRRTSTRWSHLHAQAAPVPSGQLR